MTKYRTVRRSLPWLVFILSAVAGIAIGTIGPMAEAPDASETPLPPLQISDLDLDLGEVWMQKELTFRLPVRNPGARPVNVTAFTASCNCTDLQPGSFTVSGRGIVVVQGKIDLFRSVHSVDADRQPFDVSLTAKVGGNRPHLQHWTLKGTTVRALDVHPPEIVLQGANDVIAGTFSPTIDVRITPRVPLLELKPEWFGDEADIEFFGPDFDGNYHLKYTMNENRAAGAIATRVNLTSRLEDGRIGPELEIPVRGVLVHPVRLSPPRILIGHPGSSPEHSETTVQVIDLKQAAWRIQSISGCPSFLCADYSSGNNIVFRAQLPLPHGSPSGLNLDVRLVSESGEMLELVLPLVIYQPPS